MKANPKLVKEWREDPQAKIAVIVHIHGDPQQYIEAVNEQGLSVVRAFRLTNTIAANGPARCVLDLLGASWVKKIEPDQTITTMEKGGNL